jgi:hypothetical protein
MRFALGSALVLGLLASPAAPSAQAVTQRAAPRPPAPRREAAVPFKVGETLTYDVSWSSILQAGTAVVSVKEKAPSSNSTAYSIVAEGRPIPIVARLYALHYKMDTLLDVFTLLPQRGSLDADEGAAHRTSITTFDRPAKRVFFEERSDTTTKLDYPVPAEAQDGLSTLYALRARALTAGDRITMPVADSGTLYRIDVNVGTPELVKVPAGALNAWTLKGVIRDADGQVVWNNIAVWISNDAQRLPLKLQADLSIGAFVLALRQAQ